VSRILSNWSNYPGKRGFPLNLLAAMAVSLRGYLLTAWIAGMGFVDVQRRKK